jgi:hypothetical protein
MPENTKKQKIKSELPGEIAQGSIFSNSRQIAPQFKGRFQRKRRRIPAFLKSPEALKPEPLPEILQELFPPKPQVLSIPGVPVSERKRYQVFFGDEEIGNKLTLDEALTLVKGGKL